jgi:hypothetical protein
LWLAADVMRPGFQLKLNSCGRCILCQFTLPGVPIEQPPVHHSFIAINLVMIAPQGWQEIEVNPRQGKQGA